MSHPWVKPEDNRICYFFVSGAYFLFDKADLLIGSSLLRTDQLIAPVGVSDVFRHK